MYNSFHTLSINQMPAETPKKFRRNGVFMRLGFISIISFSVCLLFTVDRPRHPVEFDSRLVSFKLREQSPRLDWNITPLSDFQPPKFHDCDQVTTQKASIPVQNAEESVRAALSLRAGIRGFHNKQGMTDPINWMAQYRKHRNNATSLWYGQPQSKHSSCDAQPPYQYPGCLVHINHHYKFIWIKGKKVGGTAIREPLGWICGDYWKLGAEANATFCSETLHSNNTITIKEAAKYWSEYFVFAFVRNPYSRFASSFTYIETLMGSCAKPMTTFDKVCRSPFLQAKVCSFLTCCWGGAVKHHIHHIMEQSSCLYTQSGDLAVDFVGETESLNEDLQTILDVINKNKAPHLPELTIPGSELKKANSNDKSPDDYAIALYEEYLSCLANVEENYSSDFQRLGYQRITSLAS